MVPTSKALTLAERVRTMRRASNAMIRAASPAPDDVGGVVRLSASKFFGIEVLSPMLASPRRNHPGLGVELVPSNSVANLLEQEMDVALRMTDSQRQSLVARKMAAIPLGFRAHRDCLAHRTAPDRLSQCADRAAFGLHAVKICFRLWHGGLMPLRCSYSPHPVTA